MWSKPSYLLFSLAINCGAAQLFVAGCGKKSGPEVPRTDSVGLLSRSAVYKMKGSRLCKGNKKGENDSSLFRNEITVVSDSQIQFWPGDVILTVYHYDSASQELLYQYLPPSLQEHVRKL